jgi:hypothetical protein
MHWALRAFLLYAGALIGQGTMIWSAGAFDDLGFSFLEGIGVYPIFAVSLVSTLLSFMFPAAYWASNEGAWGNNAPFEVFFLTSFLILPLILAFPAPKQELQEIFMSAGEYLSPFFIVWFVHGALNGFHVHLLMRNST